MLRSPWGSLSLAQALHDMGTGRGAVISAGLRALGCGWVGAYRGDHAAGSSMARAPHRRKEPLCARPLAGAESTSETSCEPTSASKIGRTCSPETASLCADAGPRSLRSFSALPASFPHTSSPDAYEGLGRLSQQPRGCPLSNLWSASAAGLHTAPRSYAVRDSQGTGGIRPVVTAFFCAQLSSAHIAGFAVQPTASVRAEQPTEV